VACKNYPIFHIRIHIPCKNNELTLKMIKGHLVVGIQNTSLSEHMQMDADLILEKAKKLVPYGTKF